MRLASQDFTGFVYVFFMGHPAEASHVNVAGSLAGNSFKTQIVMQVIDAHIYD
jgi:hypothetical protein